MPLALARRARREGLAVVHPRCPADTYFSLRSAAPSARPKGGGRRRAEGAAPCEDVRGYWRGCDIAEEMNITLRGCKKVHFYCIFLQKYLHISKKSSIFAADLGIVPAITI